MGPPLEIARIVLTGGPCAGKTTTLSYLRQELAEHGVFTITVPETARTLIGSGFIPSAIGKVAFQHAYIRMQLANEDQALALLAEPGVAKGSRVLLLCDRGAMDSRAYLSTEEFETVLKRGGWSVPRLRDARYDGIIHLVTAANGAEQYYAQDGERFETLEQARALDEATQHAWVGHGHLSVIGNETDFEGKKKRVLHQILHHLGMPVPLEIERKFAIEDRGCLALLPPHAERVRIEQGYLAQRGSREERIRKRTQGDHSVCYRTTKEPVAPGIRREREFQISLEEYERLTRAVANGDRIVKDRWCFLHKGQYFELDDFAPMGLEFCLLEIELTDINQHVALPDWLSSARDVTGEERYSNKSIAARAA